MAFAVIRIRYISAAFILFAFLTSHVGAVEFDLRSIGDLNNPDDRNYGFGRFGAVRYEYAMAANEVTTDKYVDFLNAVAKDDTFGLFDRQMALSSWGGVLRSGEEGNYSYSIKPHFANKPIGYIDYWDASRFANWMHNGQPTGPQNEQTTEDGAYYLGGVKEPINETVHRKPGAKWFLPTEDEWYKAGHYDPRTEAEGGPPGDTHYWVYGTMSNEVPGKITTDNFGDVTNPGPNVANYNFASSFGPPASGYPGSGPATAGSAGSKSYYGLYDLAGSMWEWNEAIISRPARSDATFRGNRGASWDDPASLLPGWMQGIGGVRNCGTEFLCFTQGNGFRLGTIENRELADFDADGVLDVDDIDLLTEALRAERKPVLMDINLDGEFDTEDHRALVRDQIGIPFGDANVDGAFSSTDLVGVFQHGEYNDSLVHNSTWRTGDWNGDGEFTADDFDIAGPYTARNVVSTFAVAAVPEPNAGALALVGFLMLAGFRRP